MEIILFSRFWLIFYDRDPFHETDPNPADQSETDQKGSETLQNCVRIITWLDAATLYLPLLLFSRDQNGLSRSKIPIHDFICIVAVKIVPQPTPIDLLG